MSTLWKRTINGREVLFVNSSRGTRHGFAHDTEVFIDGRNYGKHTCHYLNRTWESYTYQTVMKCCTYDLIEKERNWQEREYKERNGYKKLTAKRREEFEREFNGTPEVKLYYAILKEL